MFKELNEIMAPGTDLSLAIKKDGVRMTVLVLPKASRVKDPAKNQIVPLVISGLPEELDNGFLSAVTKPVKAVCDFLSSIEEFEKAAQQAAAESRMCKGQKEKATLEEKAKKEKYDAMLAKADGCIAAGQYAEAVPILEQAMGMAPEKDLQKIEKRINAAKEALGLGSLFGSEDETDSLQPSGRPGSDNAHDVFSDGDDLPEESDSRFQMQPC